MELIKSEIYKIQEIVLRIKGVKISEERAFNYLVIQYYYFNELHLEKIFFDVDEMITDGANDGGVDFVYYDDDNSKVVLGQCKYTKNLSNASVIEELDKMSTTYRNFENGDTGSYNRAIKRELQNAIDRLPEEEAGNVEYCIFTSAEIDEDKINICIERQNNIYSKEMVTMYHLKDINSKIESTIEDIVTVDEADIRIDKAKNYLEYNTENTLGIMVNISSQSLCSIYNTYSEKGLFDLNIRKYIRNKMVDDRIKKTLDEEREDFWFLNNGIIIACEEFRIDGNKIKVYGFSIVNGGQTTNLIGNYKGKNREVFYIPCKIISKNKRQGEKSSNIEFFSKIAEATNSQKPILSRDLKSNAPEMRNLKKWLSEEKIFLEIKRGESKNTKGYKYKIKNDELGQLILSFVYQKPGTSRSGKKTIFENKSIYNQVFKNNYSKDRQKKNCIIDLIDLNNRYMFIEEDIKKKVLRSNEKEIIKNGKQVIFALLGVLYDLANEDIMEEDLIQDTRIVKTHDFIYAPIISNYKEDDIDNILRILIIDLVQIVTESYDKALRKEQASSISNYFKTDKRYLEEILTDFMYSYSRTSVGQDIKRFSKIFIRK